MDHPQPPQDRDRLEHAAATPAHRPTPSDPSAIAGPSVPAAARPSVPAAIQLTESGAPAVSETQYELAGQWLTEVEVRQLLVANGIAIPVATQAEYDETVDEGTGWQFMLTPRWIAVGLIVLVYAAIGVGTIALAVQWIVGDVARHDVSAIDSPMTYILGALLYLAVGIGIVVFVVREKYRNVNRLDPRLWIRELRRVQRRARKPLTDAEMEDWILDHRGHGAPALPALERRPER
jgi:hypothetical protein